MAILMLYLVIQGNIEGEVLVEAQRHTAAAVVYPNLIWEIFRCIFDGIFV